MRVQYVKAPMCQRRTKMFKSKILKLKIYVIRDVCDHLETSNRHCATECARSDTVRLGTIAHTHQLYTHLI